MGGMDKKWEQIQEALHASFRGEDPRPVVSQRTLFGIPSSVEVQMAKLAAEIAHERAKQTQETKESALDNSVAGASEWAERSGQAERNEQAKRAERAERSERAERGGETEPLKQAECNGQAERDEQRGQPGQPEQQGQADQPGQPGQQGQANPPSQPNQASQPENASSSERIKPDLRTQDRKSVV